MGACFPFYPVWVGFALLGALIGPVLGDIDAYGFAMTFPAVFIVLLRGMWRSILFARPWLVSLAAAATVYLVVPGACFVLAGTLAGLTAAFFWAGKQ